jgi:hypothetical protein
MGSYTTGSFVKSMLNSGSVNDCKTSDISELKHHYEQMSNAIVAKSSNWDFASNASVYTYLSLEAYMNGYSKSFAPNGMLMPPPSASN